MVILSHGVKMPIFAVAVLVSASENLVDIRMNATMVLTTHSTLLASRGCWRQTEHSPTLSLLMSKTFYFRVFFYLFTRFEGVLKDS